MSQQKVWHAWIRLLRFLPQQLDVIQQAVPAVLLGKVSLYRRLGAMAQVRMSHHQVPTLTQCLRRGIIPVDMLRHAVHKLHNPLGRALR